MRKIRIITLGIGKSCLTKLDQSAEYYNCEIIETNNEQQLYEEVAKIKENVVVALYIDENTKERMELSTRLKAEQNVQIFFISHEVDPDQRVRWLGYGAAAYIYAPFNAEELFRRATNLLDTMETEILRDNLFEINLLTHEINYNNKQITVSPHLFRLIVHMVENPGVLITKDEILETVCHYESWLTSKVVDRLIWQLRQKTNPNIIITKRGKGYIYIPNIK